MLALRSTLTLGVGTVYVTYLHIKCSSTARLITFKPLFIMVTLDVSVKVPLTEVLTLTPGVQTVLVTYLGS